MVQSKQEQYLQGEGARMTQAELFSRMLAAPALAHLQADGLLSVHQGVVYNYNKYLLPHLYYIFGKERRA